MSVPVRPIAVAAAVTAVAVCAVLAVRDRRLRGVLVRERAAHRVADARLCEDLLVFRARLAAVARVESEEACVRDLFAEADRIVDEALASSGVNDPYEGGPA